MAGETVMSGDLRLRVNDKTIFHAIGCTLSMSREVQERETKDTSGTERSKSTKSWSASYNGLVTFAGDGVGTHDFHHLFDIYNDDTTTLPTVEFLPGDTGATFKYTGEGIIDSLEGDWQNDEDGTVSMNIVGSGPITKEAVT